ncbi:MAG: YihY/virulence factor BrkB family protein [Syntrophales bacterium]
MKDKFQNMKWIMGRLFSFLLRVIRSFRHNQGLLLSGAIAYYTLLSIVPLATLTLILLSHFMEREQLFQIISIYLDMVIPGYAAALTKHVSVFLEHRSVNGFIGFLSMLFFSSIAFTVFENAMMAIFSHRRRIQHRHVLISVIIPYVYISLIGLGILSMSFIAGLLEAMDNRQLILFGLTLSLEGATRIGFYLSGLIGEMLMITSLYLVMPIGRIKFHHALIGGLTATILWEITRRVVVWYYKSVSFVDIIYGSVASTVVFLLSIEAAAIIILLGAQVIAELESKTDNMSKEHFRF